MRERASYTGDTLRFSEANCIEASAEPEYPEDSFDDFLRDLGLTEHQVTKAMVELERRGQENGTNAAIKALEKFREYHSQNLDGASLMIALFNHRATNLSEVARKFGVPRQAVQKRVVTCRRKYVSPKKVTLPHR